MSTDLVIDLDAPQDGVVPKALHNLHEEQLKEAVLLIRRLAKPAQAKRAASLAPLGAAAKATPPTRRGLLIEGERGIGKTSFLYALGEAVNDRDRVPPEDKSAGQPQVHALPLLDPTLISGDRTFIAAVIANILGEVERCLGHQNSCDPRHRDQRQALDKALKALHGGLIAEAEDTWRGLTARDAAGHQFVDHLLQMAKGGIDLAERFEAYCRSAADLLGADMLLQPLDDVDLAGPEAYTTLEAVRRYMTGPSLLPVVAGDLQQFMGVIWERRLAEEERGLRAREARSAGERQQREEELRGVAAQHLDKLLPPPHRFPLESRRRAVLERGVHLVNGVQKPILGVGPSGSPPMRAASLVGEAERSLLRTPGDRVSGLLLGLLPANTRALLTALRMLRDVTSGAGGNANRGIASTIGRFAQMFASSLSLIDLRSQDLALIVASGPQQASAAGLQRLWPELELAGRYSLETPDALGPARSLVVLSLGAWLAERPARSVVLLGVHAPYLGPLAGSGPVAAGPETVARRISAAGQAIATALLPPGTSRANWHALYWRQAAGMWLREVRPGKTSNNAFYGTLTRLVTCHGTLSDELAPFHAWRRSAQQSSPSAGSKDPLAAAFLRPADLVLANCPDAALALGLARTYLRASNGRVWIVDPCRTLETAGRVLAAVEGLTAAEAEQVVGTTLLHQFRDESPAYSATPDGSRPSAAAVDVDVDGSTPDGAGALTGLSALAKSVATWALSCAELSKAPSPAAVAMAHGAWRSAQAEVAAYYEGKLASVGGFLERSTLALFAAAIETELVARGGPVDDNTVNDEQIEKAWVRARATQGWAVIYKNWAGETHAQARLTGPGKGEPLTDDPRQPAGRLDALVEVLTLRSGGSLAEAERWGQANLPLSTMLVKCPLLSAHLSAVWRNRLGGVWTVPSPQGGSTPDAYTLLSGIPIPPDYRANEQVLHQSQITAILGTLFSDSERAAVKAFGSAEPANPPVATEIDRAGGSGA